MESAWKLRDRVIHILETELFMLYVADSGIGTKEDSKTHRKTPSVKTT